MSVEFPRFRLFILGSGFSRAAGHPIGIELLEMVRARSRQHFQQYDWDGPLEKEITEWHELYPGKELSLESVLAYSHRKHFLQLIGSDEYFGHGSRSIVTAREIIQDILSRPINEESQDLYRQFAEQLRPTDLILTFNYDTVLEDALDSIGKGYSLTPEWWLEGDNSTATTGEYQARYIDILKLHGSIDWYDKEYYESTRQYYASQGRDVPDDDPLFGPDASVPIESLARGPVSNGYGDTLLSRVYRVPNHRGHFPFQPKSYTTVPFLLPPAHDKLLGSDPIRELWSNMHRTMDAFSMITVIGYSMPEYDGYAYEALGRLLIDYQAGGEKNYWGQSRIPVQIVTLAESEDEVLTSIPFLDRDKTRIWLNGFGDASLDWLDWNE